MEGWQCYARQSMSMAVRTWILAITCMSAVVIHPVIPTSGYIKRPSLANGDLRHKRIEAHRALNQVVNSGIMTKKGIYIWLQNRFGLREKDMHIGKFSEYRCEETARECKALLEQHTKRKQTVSNKTDLAA